MVYTERFTEVHKLLGRLQPATYNSEQNVPSSGWIDLTNYHRAVVIIHVGDTGTTLDADIEIATSSGGADIHTLKSITQLASGADNDIVAIEIRGEELAKPTGAPAENYRYLRVETTPNGNCTYDVLVLGFVPRYAPVGTTEWTEVVV